jgi:hypothetical protein
MQRVISYNPTTPPNPSVWLELAEDERIRIVSLFHMVNRLKTGIEQGHAAVHVIVENQIAMGIEPTVRAIARLQTQGLSRHDALHAIGSVISSYVFEATRTPEEAEPGNLQAQISAAIERLDARSWRQKYGT